MNQFKKSSTPHAMWHFVKPTRPKMWIAIALWGSYWLIGQISSVVAIPITEVFYPGYFANLMHAVLPQTEKLTAAMDDNGGVLAVFFTVHIVVAAVVGYFGACLVTFLLKNEKFL